MSAGAIHEGLVVGDDVRLLLTSVTRDEVKAVVESVNDFWSDPARAPCFLVGEELTLRRFSGCGGHGHWIITHPKGLPWFVLSEDGSFEHYR